MSALDRLVVGSRSWVGDLLLLLLLLLVLLRSTLAPAVLGLVVLVLAHSVHTVLTIVSVVWVLVTTTVAIVVASVVLEVSTTTSHVISSSSELTTVSSEVSTLAHLLPSSTVGLLLWLTRGLITVLVLNALLGQNELLGSEWVSRLTEIFITMGEVALLLEKAVFVGFIMSASLSLVFLVELLPLLLSRGGESLVHSHLVVHHVLLLELSLAVVAHHAHHLVVEHLLRHLAVLTLHLLHVHTHVVHIGWHCRHLVGLHLVCSVHIEI